MLRPVSQGQTRFTVPGLIADSQGVAFGPQASILLPTVGHLVGFLRSAGREQPLSSGLPKLTLYRARLMRGGPVVIAEFESRGRHGLDRANALARLHQGQLYTGTELHRVRYRDGGAANGYDVDKLTTKEGAERIFYDRPLPRALERLEPLSFDRLVRQLALTREANQRLSPEMFVRTPGALMRRLVRHLVTRGADVQVAMLDMDGQSEAMLSARRVPEGLWPLLEGMPQVRVYRREHARIFVQRGWKHPLDLPGCASLLSGESWLFFDAPNSVTAAPSDARFTRSEDIIIPELATPSEDAVAQVHDSALKQHRFAVRLGKRTGAQGATVARLLRGPHAFQWLERLVYIAPTELLAGNRVVSWDDHILVLGDDGGPPVPLGEPLREIAPNVYIPNDYGISPRLPASQLTELLAPSGMTLLLPTGGYRFAQGAARPLSRAVISDMPMAEVEAIALEPTGEVQVVPSEPGVFRRFIEGLR